MLLILTILNPPLFDRKWTSWSRRCLGRTSLSPCGRRGRNRNRSLRTSSTHSASGSRSESGRLYWMLTVTRSYMPHKHHRNIKTIDRQTILHQWNHSHVNSYFIESTNWIALKQYYCTLQKRNFISYIHIYHSVSPGTETGSRTSLPWRRNTGRPSWSGQISPPVFPLACSWVPSHAFSHGHGDGVRWRTEQPQVVGISSIDRDSTCVSSRLQCSSSSSTTVLSLDVHSAYTYGPWLLAFLCRHLKQNIEIIIFKVMN